MDCKIRLHMTIAKNPGTISLQVTGWTQNWTYLFTKICNSCIW